MSRAVPCRLPATFDWREAEDSKRLFLGDVEVLEVRIQRHGWIVQVHLQDPLYRQPSVAVRSPNAGMRWGARWAKLRVRLLQRIAASHASGCAHCQQHLRHA
ncbi:MAG: hypothetical protein J0I01_12435 [Stenotrophomonas nitritireducens]|uniref:hypothetical protein n=1 Tax=Stenotrophomonas nitritireducens TaxID=83617 RepID=UPI001AD570FE|nr:hypothetical protein [Stenotrophomonas nitritireducens]MBN8768990.1 hypothetical protein [Stenotrophomonas sp.]MBN8793028.1 hypothetical protein [Stenotrophomonas nitritireducens]